jgi:arginyl-tRNA synthetase
MVSVTRSGEAVVQSKRAGTFIELRGVVDEIGRDACRFFFLMRRSDSQLELDIDLAKKQSLDNPVYYIQYAHARICSILRRAGELGIDLAAPGEVAMARLGAEEREVVGKLAEYPDVIADAARAREPHRVVFYVQELAQSFASYFTRLQKMHHDTILPQRSQRVCDWRASWDWEKTRARLAWVAAIRRVFADALGLLGVSAPERMEKLPSDDATPEEEEPFRA